MLSSPLGRSFVAYSAHVSAALSGKPVPHARRFVPECRHGKSAVAGAALTSPRVAPDCGYKKTSTYTPAPYLVP